MFKVRSTSGIDLTNIVLVFAKPSAFDPCSYEVYQEAALSLGFVSSQIKFVSEAEALVRGFLKEDSRIPSSSVTLKSLRV